MSFPSFSTGEVLTAADMNAVGLWLVKSQTVGTGVSSVEVTGAFSADYANYVITYTGGTTSASVPIRVQLGATTTGYYGTLIYGTYANTLINANVNDNNGARFTYVGAGTTDFARLVCNLENPFASTRTFISAGYVDAGNAGTYNGFLANNTSYTAFTLSPNSGTMTGGTIRVYGRRN
jgi:hypothetical protein